METKYLIWSFEHNAWWKANSNGYTTIREEAGVYELEEAYNIVLNANINFYSHGKSMPNEALIPFEVCGTCGGVGEVTSMARVWANEPHMAPVETSPCPECNITKVKRMSV